MSHIQAVIKGQGQKAENEQVETPKDLAIHEVLVRNTAIAVNPADWKIRDENIFDLVKEWPICLGYDVAGVVEQVGSSACHARVGDTVIACQMPFKDRKYAGFQEKTVIWDSLSAVIPKSKMTDEEAASIPLGFTTAGVGIFHDLGFEFPDLGARQLPKHDPILVWGGASSVGQYAIQLFRVLGYENIVTTASTKHRQHLRRLGAKHVIDYQTGQPDPEVRKKTLVDRILECTAQKKFRWIFDATAVEDYQEIIARVAQAPGKVAMTLPQRDSKWPDGVRASVISYSRVYNANNKDFGRELWKFGEALIAGGLLHPNPVKVIEDGKSNLAEKVEEGLRMQKEGADGKKVVISLR